MFSPSFMTRAEIIEILKEYEQQPHKALQMKPDDLSDLMRETRFRIERTKSVYAE